MEIPGKDVGDISQKMVSIGMVEQKTSLSELIAECYLFAGIVISSLLSAGRREGRCLFTVCHLHKGRGENQCWDNVGSEV